MDGTDFISSYRAMTTAAAWCREGHGPALVHAHCTRPYSHSLSDDERAYKTKHERERKPQRDPLRTFPGIPDRAGNSGCAALERMTREIDRGILEDTHRALKAPAAAPGNRDAPSLFGNRGSDFGRSSMCRHSPKANRALWRI